MNSAAHDTALYLAGLTGFGAFGGADSWSVYVGREPLAPVDVVTVYDTGGGPQEGLHLRNGAVQVRVRAAAYADGWAKINAAFEALMGETGRAIPGGLLVHWDATTDVAHIGYDDADRALFTCNFNVLRDAVSTEG